MSAGASVEAASVLGEFGGRLGVAFQLVDDVLDYAGDPRATGKAVLADLTEGKLTLPLIRALAAAPTLVGDVEAARSGNAAAAARVAQAVRSSGVCDGVRALAVEETARAAASLQALQPSVARDLLAAIARELASRVS